eukprot:788865-Pelagomonas_calceolata.AAC.1
MNDFEGILCEHAWRSLDNLTPQEAHASGRVMKTYHAHFGVPLGSLPGWRDKRKGSNKLLLPLYLRQDVPQIITLHVMLTPFQSQTSSGNPMASWK